MSKPKRAPLRPRRDALEGLGDRIGQSLKKGMSKLEELIADSRKSGDENAACDARLLDYVKVLIDGKNIGSVAPSSKYLVERMAKAADLESARVVVEYGPATGVITRRLLHKMRPDARLIAVEYNETFLAELTARVKDPRFTAVHGDVREIDRVLAPLGVTRADRVVSGVPFALFSGHERRAILTKTSTLLVPGGRFVAFGYTTHLIPMLKDHFSSFDIQFEVRNLPPSFVFTALK